MTLVARVWPAPRFQLLIPHWHSAIYLRRNLGAGDGNRTLMTSLEVRSPGLADELRKHRSWSLAAQCP
jgi:hypothetical protein